MQINRRSGKSGDYDTYNISVPKIIGDDYNNFDLSIRIEPTFREKLTNAEMKVLGISEENNVPKIFLTYDINVINNVYDGFLAMDDSEYLRMETTLVLDADTKEIPYNNIEEKIYNHLESLSNKNLTINDLVQECFKIQELVNDNSVDIEFIDKINFVNGINYTLSDLNELKVNATGKVLLGDVEDKTSTMVNGKHSKDFNYDISLDVSVNRIDYAIGDRFSDIGEHRLRQKDTGIEYTVLRGFDAPVTLKENDMDDNAKKELSLYGDKIFEVLNDISTPDTRDLIKDHIVKVEDNFGIDLSFDVDKSLFELDEDDKDTVKMVKDILVKPAYEEDYKDLRLVMYNELGNREAIDTQMFLTYYDVDRQNEMNKFKFGIANLTKYEDCYTVETKYCDITTELDYLSGIKMLEFSQDIPFNESFTEGVYYNDYSPCLIFDNINKASNTYFKDYKDFGLKDTDIIIERVSKLNDKTVTSTRQQIYDENDVDMYNLGFDPKNSVTFNTTLANLTTEMDKQSGSGALYDVKFKAFINSVEEYENDKNAMIINYVGTLTEKDKTGYYEFDKFSVSTKAVLEYDKDNSIFVNTPELNEYIQWQVHTHIKKNLLEKQDNIFDFDDMTKELFKIQEIVLNNLDTSKDLLLNKGATIPMITNYVDSSYHEISSLNAIKESAVGDKLITNNHSINCNGIKAKLNFDDAEKSAIFINEKHDIYNILVHNELEKDGDTIALIIRKDEPSEYEELECGGYETNSYYLNSLSDKMEANVRELQNILVDVTTNFATENIALKTKEFVEMLNKEMPNAKEIENDFDISR